MIGEARVFLHRGDKKLLAVSRDHVLVTEIALLNRAAERRSEQRDGLADVGRLRIRRDSDGNRHQLGHLARRRTIPSHHGPNALELPPLMEIGHLSPGPGNG